MQTCIKNNLIRDGIKPSLLSLAVAMALSPLANAQITTNDAKSFGIQSYTYQSLFRQSEPNSDNVPYWRIPSMIRSKDGTLIVAADKRWQHRGDWGDIATAIRTSTDDGKTWTPIRTILDLPSANQGFSPNFPVTSNPWG